MKRLDAYWYSHHPIVYLLLPLAGVFALLVVLRRHLYRLGFLKIQPSAVPVIVVGNITVGGTGKTPLVVWLAEYLQARGLRPGIVARGYGGKAEYWPQMVRPDTDPAQVGDEPVLLARRTACPVCVAPDRPAAVHELSRHARCDILISDDGLQHYAMQRDIEIVVIDAERRFGNGFLLPAGPLREPVSRLKDADLLVYNGASPNGGCGMYVGAPRLRPLDEVESLRCELEDLQGQRVHAIAGIGNPKRFFDLLRHYNLDVVEHGFPDHHDFVAADIRFDDNLPVLMTEKDAVKCTGFAGPEHQVVEISVQPDEAFIQRLSTLLEDRANG